MNITTPDNDYEIVVVGGGMVGASFAYALSQVLGENCPSILVVEAAALETEKSQQPSFDARSTALSFGSRQIFEALDLWPDLNPLVTAIHEIQVSDKGRFGSTQLTREELKVEALGYVIENADLGSVLNEKLSDCDQIALLAPASIEQITPRPEGMDLSIELKGESDVQGKSFAVSASLVVLAEGGRSSICQQLGIEQNKEKYQQHAIITNIAFEKPHQNIAFERFTEHGPLAVLPLRTFEGENRCSLVWTTAETDSEGFMELGESELLTNLQSSFGNRLGKLVSIGQKFCFPLSLSIAKEQIRPGLVLLGNVAHTLHPVAGQGLNLALRDIDALVKILDSARKNQQSLGSMQILQSYVDTQEFDQQKAIRFTDSLTKLFSSNNPAKVATRKFGLLSLELIPAVRKAFTEQAMGFSGKV
jgi:2-octaprenyl-6-methoxyphenol hydroxylase